MGVFHVTLVLLLIMQRQPAYFSNFMDCFKSRKASYVRQLVKAMHTRRISDELVYNFVSYKEIILMKQKSQYILWIFAQSLTTFKIRYRFLFML